MFSFDHIHIVCDELTVMGNFLEMLGASLDRRNELTKNWEYTFGNVRLFVRAFREGEVKAGEGAHPVDHFGLTVRDIRAAETRLLDAGCTVRVPIKQVRPDLATAFYNGPAGLVIELLQRG